MIVTRFLASRRRKRQAPYWEELSRRMTDGEEVDSLGTIEEWLARR